MDHEERLELATSRAFDRWNRSGSSPWRFVAAMRYHRLSLQLAVISGLPAKEVVAKAEVLALYVKLVRKHMDSPAGVILDGQVVGVIMPIRRD